MKNNLLKSQLLLELLLAISIFTAISIVFLNMINSSLSHSKYFKTSSVADSLLVELQERTKAVADSNWNSIYNATKGPCSDKSCHYKIIENNNQWQIKQGEETSTISNIEYTRYIVIYNVQRDSNNNIVETGGTNDPLTQKIVSHIKWDKKERTIATYITRSFEETESQTDWSDGPVGEKVTSETTTTFSTSTLMDYYTTSGQISLIFEYNNSISYGQESLFNQGLIYSDSVSSLTSTSFVIAYRDDDNNKYGTAIIGNISGTSTISYGPEYVFYSNETDYVSVSSLTSSSFVIAYLNNNSYGSSVIGNVSGTSTINFGSNYVFTNTLTTKTSVSSLTSSSFVVAYEGHSNNYGNAKIGNISGTSTISYGPEYIFNNGGVDYNSVSSLTSTSFVIAYRNSGGNSSGTAIVGNISGTSSISFGSKYVFTDSSITYSDISRLSQSKFVISYGFPKYDSINNKWLYNATAIIGNISGTSTINYGSEYIFDNNGSGNDSDWIPVSSLDSSHFVISYNDRGNNTYGTAIIGSISGTSTISYGPEYVFNNASTYIISNSSLDQNRFVVAYRDDGNNYYGTATIGRTNDSSNSSGTLISLIYDTEQETGSALTGLIWNGEVPSGANVEFKLGSSNSTSSESFNWTGPYNSNIWKTDWWQVSIPLSDLSWHNNHRYIRYKVKLISNSNQETPIIYKIILKWAK